VVVGAWVVEERDEVAMRGELQILVAQIGHQAREFEQLVFVVERGGIQCDLHLHPDLLGEVDGDAFAALQRADARPRTRPRSPLRRGCRNAGSTTWMQPESIAKSFPPYLR
jgi:hypothetical protein